MRAENAKAIDELRLRDAEDLHATKIKLETDVQILEQQLESMTVEVTTKVLDE